MGKLKRNTSELPLIEMSFEKFSKIINDEKVYFSRKPIKFGNNIFSYQLVKLAQGEEIIMDDYNYRAVLIDADKLLSEILVLFAKCPFNDIHPIFHIFIETHPRKDEILKTLTKVYLKK